MRIAVVGAGFGGLCAAIQLRKHGFDDLVVFEKASSIGGTWRDNVYPGAACDSPSFAYCFSFAQKTDWTRKWAKQPEILDYIRHLARAHDVERHVRLGTELASARWDGRCWRLVTTDGSEDRADVLVTSVGQLNRPSLPRIPGLETFGGPAFHTARWPEGFTPRGKRVAMIGTGATAIQAVPEVAREATELVLFQRTPSWVLPKNDREYGPCERLVYQRVPGAARVYRSLLWLGYELRWPAVTGEPLTQWLAKTIATRHLEEQVKDPALRVALTPNYPITGKRVLISDDYYPALVRPNVTVVPEALAKVEPGAVTSASGRRFEVDALILATGFRTTEFLAPMEIHGTSGSLGDAWKDGAAAYLGMRVAGFPNLFLLYGPNTNLGHNSILFMLECQAHHLVTTLRAAEERGAAWTDVKPAVQAAYDERIQRRLETSAWAQVGESWYKNEAGRITNNWPGPTVEYWWRTRRVDLADYDLG